MTILAAIIIGFALGVATVGIATLGCVAWIFWRERRNDDVLRRAMNGGK